MYYWDIFVEKGLPDHYLIQWKEEYLFYIMPSEIPWDIYIPFL